MRKKGTVMKDDVIELITDRYPKSFKPILMYDVLTGYATGYYDGKEDKFYSSKIISNGMLIVDPLNHPTELENVSGWAYLSWPIDALN